VVRSLSQLVGVSPFMMWRDTTFSVLAPPLLLCAWVVTQGEESAYTTVLCEPQQGGKQAARERFVLVGATAACVVQIEYYSNFCGGPFANFSCGMG
jgi:hypothetical protein